MLAAVIVHPVTRTQHRTVDSVIGSRPAPSHRVLMQRHR